MTTPNALLSRQRLYILNRDRWTCQDCGYVSSRKPFAEDVLIHHIIPRREGGTHAPENLVTLCRSCHSCRHSTLRRERPLLYRPRGRRNQPIPGLKQPPPPPLLTPEEVARALRVNVSTVRYWLRGVRVGQRWRIRRRDLERYIAGGENLPPEETPE